MGIVSLGNQSGEVVGLALSHRFYNCLHQGAGRINRRRLDASQKGRGTGTYQRDRGGQRSVANSAANLVPPPEADLLPPSLPRQLWLPVIWPLLLSLKFCRQSPKGPESLKLGK
jgi:hypothetical protein